MAKHGNSRSINGSSVSVTPGSKIRSLLAFYRKSCDGFEKYLPLVVMGSFILGVFISDIPSVAEIVYSGMDGFVDLYGLFAPLVIFIILAPSLSRMVTQRRGKRGNFISYAIYWLSFRRFLSLIWAVIFTSVVFGFQLYEGGDSANLFTSLKVTGKNLIYMFATSRYFYAMYLSVVALFIAKKYKPFSRFMDRLLRGVEDIGQYLVPIIPVFMLAIGVYVAQLDVRLNDQILSGYDEQINTLGMVETMTPKIEAKLATLSTLRVEAEIDPMSLNAFTILDWKPDVSGDYSMVWVYVLISLVIGLACIIWHFGLIGITKAKVKDFLIWKYFTKYWIKVYPLLWATSSEAIAVPMNLYLVKRHYPNVRPRVRQFTIGVGSYLSINGTMICVIVLAGAVASILGVELTAVQLFLAIPIVFLIGFGVPGIPGELILFAGPLLQLFDLSPEIQPIFLALYLGLQIGLPDSFRTGNNSTDDCVMSILLNKEYENKFYDDRIFISELLEDSLFTRLFASHAARRMGPFAEISPHGLKAMEDEPQLVFPARDGEVIKKDRRIRVLFRRGKELAKLHAVISSPRGGFYRFRLLQLLENRKNLDELIVLKENETIEGIDRHLSMLQKFSLVIRTERDEEIVYTRTIKGEQAINALRALGRRVGEEAMSKIIQASFGVNSIRLFLRAYGYKKEVDFRKPEIEFTPFEIGDITRFLPHTVEGISAIDKLAVAEILVYSDGGNICMNALRARALFLYLEDLYQMLRKPISYQLLMEESSSVDLWSQNHGVVASDLPKAEDHNVRKRSAYQT